MSEKFLETVYAARDSDATRAIYDSWSSTYEDEVASHGYATPDRCAAALAQFVDDLTAPILDMGCGTGLAGVALRNAGFLTIDGVDLSADMLEIARSKGIYRNLKVIDAEARLTPGAYTAIAAVGVIGAGAAPATLLSDIMHALPSGGKSVFSFNDHTLADPGFEAAVNEWVDCGAACLLFREYGDHLPGIDIKSNVYVLEKA
ncbi:class I SAM-dependent methyltransferase [Sulfitobacter sp. S190]|uniref:class I SAM-dependent DNA methyltransferase n=1 Tax=Sulfitobacter sp. S190 TaxID=2867022 RepID=UPI0021A4937F|nr:methyltransferase domain-containing protein [Sulfitobacter sp. S190]UWR20873.1 methyltransferase domain-containing protein [Sulfitobacter sp. S190]